MEEESVSQIEATIEGEVSTDSEVSIKSEAIALENAIDVEVAVEAEILIESSLEIENQPADSEIKSRLADENPVKNDQQRQTKITVEQAVPIMYREIERQLVSIIGEERHEVAKNIFNELTTMGKFTYQFAVDLIAELVSELTGVKSLNVVPKGPLECDVVIKRKSELVLKLKHPIAPLVELNALTFGKDLEFGAIVDKAKQGLRMNIRKGLRLTFVLPILGEYVVDVRGSGLLSRNEKNQLLLSTTVNLPGIDQPITISIPLTKAFAQNKKA